ncbi:MAG TPA: sigma-54 dependent transcriptional regulator [Vicinamibacterales bacterium]|nr:sigma-54 dependent transcriptional regulator [Vicinamibacterales bacterium]HOQ59413.1 sigma-54 dependent transcriptional regulator [Vicinamibacterales bacterium]HPK70503.1 sigma-54 dependent transcriptional regulator [Vicinamibacterales bacterium]
MPRNDFGQLVGRSPAILALQEEIRRVALSDAKILITGESGVGKELVALSIHSHSLRADRPFVTVNCAGLPETLLESELFGHVKGSFTGAYRDKAGMLEKADEGTIFLDEIGEMSLRMQGMLLRFLETGELQKVGADRVGRHVDVRVIAATNRLIADMVSQGSFREDLYYRINVINIQVPPLRERREDIPMLVEAFLESLDNDRKLRVTPEAYAALAEYSWPGNVRELANVIERIVVSGCGPEIGLADVPVEVRSQRGISLRPKRERRRSVADELYKRMTVHRESFWTAVYPLYMQREITRGNLRELVSKGLEEAKGNYKIVTKLFNMDPGDYKRFLNFLRKHDCQLPFRDYR